MVKIKAWNEFRRSWATSPHGKVTQPVLLMRTTCDDMTTARKVVMQMEMINDHLLDGPCAVTYLDYLGLGPDPQWQGERNMESGNMFPLCSSITSHYQPSLGIVKHHWLWLSIIEHQQTSWSVMNSHDQPLCSSPIFSANWCQLSFVGLRRWWLDEVGATASEEAPSWGEGSRYWLLVGGWSAPDVYNHQWPTMIRILPIGRGLPGLLLTNSVYYCQFARMSPWKKN